MKKYAYRFMFRKDLPPGARENPNYPEHRLAFNFLNFSGLAVRRLIVEIPIF